MLLGKSLSSRDEQINADRPNRWLTRSPAGDSLVLTSSDGYCSIVVSIRSGETCRPQTDNRLVAQVFDAAELGTLHPTQQHHRQLQAIAQSHSTGHISTSHSLPPSPAPGHTIPGSTATSSRMDKDGSTSSIGSVMATPAGSFHLPGPTTPITDGTHFTTSASDLKASGIHGLPVGTAGQAPPTPRASAPGSPATLVASTSGNSTGSVKRSSEAPETDASGKPKKRRIELTRVE